MLVKNVIYGCIVPLLLADGKSPQLLRANNNKGGGFVKKADKPVVHIYGNNNNVEVNITKTSSKISVAVTIAIALIVSASILAISLCCPELLADFVRCIISVAIGG